MAAVALGFSSCKQEDEPKYKDPTKFTINTPALQDQEMLCAAEMTDAATFNIFCSQPDYGYSAICNYSVVVSLDPDCPVEEAVELENLTPTSAAMSIKTFELGAAVNKLLDVVDLDDFNNRGIGNNFYKCYFRAICHIPGIESSRIVSDNVVSYNKVKVQYAEKKPAWIYICGNVATEDNSVLQNGNDGFLPPTAANQAEYDEHWSLFEPNDMIGKKIYVGVFGLVPKKADPDPENPDDCSQFRFFSQLGGWVADYSLGSNEADFFCEKISDKVVAGYSGDIIEKGLGNWGIAVGEATPITIVVDQVNLKIYVKEGKHTVTFNDRTPNFE